MKRLLYSVLIQRLGLEQRKCISTVQKALQDRAGLKINVFVLMMIVIYKYSFTK